MPVLVEEHLSARVVSCEKMCHDLMERVGRLEAELARARAAAAERRDAASNHA